MTILEFNIEYKTQWGEELCIAGSVPQMGSLDEEKALVLSTINGVDWTTDVKLQSIGKEPLEYYYFVRKNGNILRRETTPHRNIKLSASTDFTIQDFWKEDTYHSYLFTSVFTECIFKQPLKSFVAPRFKRSKLLNVICPYVKKTEHVVISGEGDELGNWDLKRALPLSPVRYGEWQVELNMANIADGAAYKFAIVDSCDLSKVHWEVGENRKLNAEELVSKRKNVSAEMALPYRYPFFQWKGKGVSIPLFSLRSEESAGIGDFIDLKKMVDWAVDTDQDMIQILPINDTTSTATWTDSYPYSSISIFAFNPIYISINGFTLKNKTKLKKLKEEAEELNKLDEIDYEKVFALKYNFLRELFADEGDKVIQSAQYIDFCEKNEDWLFPYVCFRHLRDKYKTADFREWGRYADYSKKKLEKLLKENKESKRETDFYRYLQFIAYSQLGESKEYAQKNGVALKGDIPIGIDRNSVEAWTEPHLFNMNMQAGAPPDDFSVAGQNWGFPTYNWEEMERDNFAWWKRRFQKMADNFDAYRIDHILGFFRIWEISSHHVQGLLGHFSRAMPLSSEELHQWGFPFDEQRMAQPYIHESMLHDFFGEHVEEVKASYLDILSWERFKLKPICDTQRKIESLFEGKDDDKSNRLRDGLYGLCNEVLFVPDPYIMHNFHPRISAQHTYSYNHLNDYEKEVFNRIYDDFFYKRHNYFWYEQAMRKLPELIAATPMLVCGEDLGMVPDCVNWVMNELRILSLEIQRMPKERNMLFADLNRLPYLSVNTTSTHDMSTIRGWWLENRETTQNFYNNVLGREGAAPEQCTTEICEQIINQHLSSNSMWSILPWQDWMSIDEGLRRKNPDDERINVPANPKHYWRYRMHISLEDLMKEKAFNKRIKMMKR